MELEPGITVVVGPNGSGKSNVVDATTWVLGAQSPRTLRSQKMEDVIFAGTSSRPALGRAEVSLTIDNSSGRLPVDMAEVTITRTLFRSGESEYAINGTPCRLLDVQELLSDSGVGRQQHMIIGQGQLDAVLSARPEDRRAVIEEAAGVLKHRRRRERAERRLLNAEENLDRLGDLVREVRRQIRPLERQAAAARSHAALQGELRAVRLYLAGRELEHLAGRHGELQDERSGVGEQERQLQRRLAGLDAEAAQATAWLSSGREGDLAATMARVQGLVERSRGIAGVLRERAHGLRGALDAAADTDVVSSLEADAARLTAELGVAEDEMRTLATEGVELDREEQRLQLTARDRVAGVHPVDDPRDSKEAFDRAHERLGLVQRSADQHARATRHVETRVKTLTQRRGELQATSQRLAERAQQAQTDLDQLSAASELAESNAHELSIRTADATSTAQRTAQELHRSTAQAEALGLALDELRNQPGRKLLSSSHGAVGALADLVDIDPGWEVAFEATLLGSEGAVVVSGEDAARQAIARLHADEVNGAVLALQSRSALSDQQTVPEDMGAAGAGAEPIRRHIRQRNGHVPGLEALLDRLFDGVFRVESWEQAARLSLQRPELVIVTPSGDRFSSAGWKVRRGKAVVTANAVDAAWARARDLEEASNQAEDARREFERRYQDAQQKRDDVQRARERQDALLSSLGAEQQRTAQGIAEISMELDHLSGEFAAARAEAQEIARELATLESSLPELQQRAAAAREALERTTAVENELQEQRGALGSRRRAWEVRVASLQERQNVLSRRRTEVERRLEGHAEERLQAERRRARLERDVAVVQRLEELVAQARHRLELVHERISEAYRDQVAAARAGGERLDSLHRERNQLERQLDAFRERSRRLDLELAELSMRASSITEMVEELGSEPEEAVSASCPELPDGVAAEQHAAALSDKIAAIGPVNPLALQELSELETRAGELEGQVQDVRSARRELQQIVRLLNQEIMETFASAAADVNEHFSDLVHTLFPGGTGRLALTEPENLLETGVDIEVRPAGRNVRRVSLLSGGERSLVAIAFLFAVFRSRPSPFYLMDEVEAALDDVNLHRFLDLLKEFREEAQLIIVSHQKRTMEQADALYGVTMAPGGSSQVVSQKVANSQAANNGHGDGDVSRSSEGIASPVEGPPSSVGVGL